MGMNLADLGDVIEGSRAIAAQFVAARRDARALEAYPGALPLDLAMAYRIQDQAIALDGRSIAGWKVGRIMPPADVTLGANRLAGPIFTDTFAEAVGSVPNMPIYVGGFSAAEAEFLLHVAPGLSGTLPRNDEETKALIDDVRMGIEIASSPYPGINDNGAAVTASDFGNNAGLVLGAKLEGWRDIDLCAIPIRTEIDGVVVGEKTAASMLDGPYGAVRFLLGNLAERGIDISGGIWVSSGAVTGVHSVRSDQFVVAHFGDHGSVGCRLSAATARTG
jgi:2-keto-4-pentenoate hydratase